MYKVYTYTYIPITLHTEIENYRYIDIHRYI